MRIWLVFSLLVAMGLAGCIADDSSGIIPPEALAEPTPPEGEGTEPTESPSEPTQPEPEPPEEPDDPEPTPTQPLRIAKEQDGARVTFSFIWDAVPEIIHWDFGDGKTSSEPAPTHTFNPGNFTIVLRAAAGERVEQATTQVRVQGIQPGFIPRVVVGVADSGFNVYHDVYSRPLMTAHPCTYVEGYPCEVPALELTLDEPDWQTAYEADREIWESIMPGDRYWIPGTNIIGAACMQPYSGSTAATTDPTGAADHCILDDTSMHGTGTSSSVLSENPDALLIIVEGNSGGAREYLADDYWPVDIISHSWGSAAPLPVLCSAPCSATPLVVIASGNEGAFPIIADGDGMSDHIFTVGAADAGARTEPGYSGWKTMDYVSEYCRETAQTRSTTAMRDQYCGTSFSAPTFAGAMSRVVWELRQMSGYTGSVENGIVDPILGITEFELREALNRTATYEPEDKWDDSDSGVPLVAPWYQWGWGYYDSTQVDATLACLLESVCPARPAETVAYMEAMWALRTNTP